MSWITIGLGAWHLGEVTCQVDFSPVLHAVLIRQKFLKIQSGKRVLINVPNNTEYQPDLYIYW